VNSLFLGGFLRESNATFSKIKESVNRVEKYQCVKDWLNFFRA